jgi:hypothetical protein
MRLPPVDIYRRPFIEPLGHLVLFAAKADHALIDLVVIGLPLGEDTTQERVSEKLRNWGKDAKAFAVQAVSSVDNEAFVQRAKALIESYDKLREKRHRAIHDAVEPGIFTDDDGSGLASVAPLRVGYVKANGVTSLRIDVVTPESVAELAYEFYDLAADLEALQPYTPPVQAL